MTLYQESGIDEILPDFLVIDEDQYYLYGDAACMIRPWLQASFCGLLIPAQEECIETMKVP